MKSHPVVTASLRILFPLLVVLVGTQIYTAPAFCFDGANLEQQELYQRAAQKQILGQRLGGLLADLGTRDQSLWRYERLADPAQPVDAVFTRTLSTVYELLTGNELDFERWSVAPNALDLAALYRLPNKPKPAYVLAMITGMVGRVVSLRYDLGSRAYVLADYLEFETSYKWSYTIDFTHLASDLYPEVIVSGEGGFESGGAEGETQVYAVLEAGLKEVWSKSHLGVVSFPSAVGPVYERAVSRLFAKDRAGLAWIVTREQQDVTRWLLESDGSAEHLRRLKHFVWRWDDDVQCFGAGAGVLLRRISLANEPGKPVTFEQGEQVTVVDFSGPVIEDSDSLYIMTRHGAGWVSKDAVAYALYSLEDVLGLLLPPQLFFQCDLSTGRGHFYRYSFLEQGEPDLGERLQRFFELPADTE